MRIGLDLDGIVYNWDKTVRYMLRTMKGYPREGPLGHEALHWDYIQENVKPEDWKWVWSEAIDLGLFRYGHLYTGAIEAVRNLADFADVVVITSRHPRATKDTLDFLAYLKLPFREIHILGRELKSSVPVCDLYIDDGPHNAVDI